MAFTPLSRTVQFNKPHTRAHLQHTKICTYIHAYIHTYMYVCTYIHTYIHYITCLYMIGRGVSEDESKSNFVLYNLASKYVV